MPRISPKKTSEEEKHAVSAENEPIVEEEEESQLQAEDELVSAAANSLGIPPALTNTIVRDIEHLSPKQHACSLLFLAGLLILSQVLVAVYVKNNK